MKIVTVLALAGYFEVSPRFGQPADHPRQSATSAGSRSVSLASQPYCRMSLSTSYRPRRWHGSQTTPKSGPRRSDTNATVRSFAALPDQPSTGGEHQKAGVGKPNTVRQASAQAAPRRREVAGIRLADACLRIFMSSSFSQLHPCRLHPQHLESEVELFQHPSVLPRHGLGVPHQKRTRR
jgi:hypothetical protein